MWVPLRVPAGPMQSPCKEAKGAKSLEAETVFSIIEAFPAAALKHFKYVNFMNPHQTLLTSVIK